MGQNRAYSPRDTERTLLLYSALDGGAVDMRTPDGKGKEQAAQTEKDDPESPRWSKEPLGHMRCVGKSIFVC